MKHNKLYHRKGAHSISIQPVAANAAYSPAAAEKVQENQPVQPESSALQSGQPRRIEPAFDEYIPEENRGKMPRMMPQTERTTTNTDKVDREIESLKKKLEELENRLNTAAPEQREALERQVAQVQQELAQKDNDGYRRQNAVVS